jgi:hypothetical protein
MVNVIPSLSVAISNEKKRVPASGDLVRQSALYQHFQAQLQEIHKHKWYESEKAGHDIGFERALTQWSMKHRAGWLKDRQRQMNGGLLCPPPPAPRTELHAT